MEPTPAPARAPRGAALRALALAAGMLGLSGCAAMGALLSPYPEKFSCKNDDHGQCIHPEQAYEDAVAGRRPRSDPRVTNRAGAASAKEGTERTRARDQELSAYPAYRDSLYRELKGLIDDPVTPMLKPAQSVRTLILPYADRRRPDRLYMPRYVYSIIERPVWVVGGYLVEPGAPARQGPVVSQQREKDGPSADRIAAAGPGLPDASAVPPAAADAGLQP